MSAFADARGYELMMRRWSRLLGRELVHFAGISGQERVLDVGCGTGSLSAAVLAATPHVQVVGIDLSSTFVEAARDVIRDPRARFEIGDAQRLDFPDGSFDCAMAMIALNFVPQPGVAAAETRRVTRPGGRMASCVWDYGGEMTMLRSFWDAATALDPSAVQRHEGRMALCRPGELEALWHATGLEEVRAHDHDRDALRVVRRLLAAVSERAGTGGRVRRLPVTRHAARPRGRLRADLWDDRPDVERVLPALAWAVAGTVPDPAAA